MGQGLGSVLLAQDIAESDRTRKKKYGEAEDQFGKRSRWGGWGRGLLGLAGTALGATVGMPWLGAGIGSYLGTRGGQALAGRVGDMGKTAFGAGRTEDLQKNIRTGRSDESSMALGRAGRDALTAWLAKPTINKGMDKLAQWGADKPQYLGDWGSRNFGIGGDKFAQGVTSKTLADPRMSWLKDQQGLTEDQINDQFWNNMAPSPIANKPAGGYQSIIKQHSQNRPILEPTVDQNAGLEMGGTDVFSGNPSGGIPSIQDAQTHYNQNLAPPRGSMPTRASVLTGGSAQKTPVSEMVRNAPPSDMTQRGMPAWAGSGMQNRLLAQAMGFDQNKSIIDQMQGVGADSSYANRGGMWQDYMQGNIRSPIFDQYLSSQRGDTY